MPSLNTLTLHEAAELLAAGKCSSEELVRDLMAAIKKTDPKVQAYLTLDAESALAQACAADKTRKGRSGNPLFGIPLAIKDVLNVEGQPCTCGSKILKGYTSPYDATAVAKLRALGAIFLGRVNMDEFAMGSSTENSAYQVTRNPWNLDRVPGGSSGGSAAAVAAHEAIASLGTDTGGSIRQPASFCGCVGLKPTYGRVSRYGLTAFASSLDQIGPLAKDVRDAAILLGGIAGHDPMDSTSVDVPVPDYAGTLKTDLRGMTLGLPKEYFVKGMDADVERAVRAAVEQCRTLGAEIKEVSLPHTKYAIATYYVIATAEASANLARFDGVRYGARVEGEDPIDMYGKTRAAGFGTEVKRRIILGTYVLSSGYYDAYYLRAQKVRTLIRQDFAEVFKACDAILTPVAPTAAYRIGEKTDDPLQMYLGDIFTVTANLAGICGLSVPCGFTGDRLPVGLQILGPAFGEENILRVGHAYEQSTEWHRQRPSAINH
ncbi:MAG: Asp-tRNA(Asn)/Glu-tRNA(Gln) amidotransferase subunit GatA [Verrucomicrobiota bacterium]